MVLVSVEFNDIDMRLGIGIIVSEFLLVDSLLSVILKEMDCDMLLYLRIEV